MGKNASKVSKSRKSQLNILQVSVISGGALPMLRKLSSRITQLDTIQESFHRITIKHCQSKLTLLHIDHEQVISRSTALLYNLYRDAKGLSIIIDVDEDGNIETAQTLLKVLLKEEQLKGLPILVSVKVNRDGMDDTDIIEEVTNKLCLGEITQRLWYVTTSEDISVAGFQEGLEWLVQSM